MLQKARVRDTREDADAESCQETVFEEKFPERLACKFSPLFEDLEAFDLSEPQTPERELNWADLFRLITV
jgi:hypothetical protein